MSCSSAPSRRSRITSSTLCRTVTWSDFMGGHRVAKPCVIESVQPGVAAEAILLKVAARAEVGRALQRVLAAVGQGEGHELAVGPRRGDALAAPDAQHRHRLGENV